MVKKESFDKKNFKVLIGYPPADYSKGIAQLGQNRQFQYFHNPTFLYPVVPATAATMLKVKGYSVIWKDAIAEGLTEQQFFEYLTKEKPDLFALESKAPTIKIYWKFINKAKTLFPKMKIVLMGDHVSAFPEESLKNSNVDYVLVGGHYDFALLELCDAITNNEKIPQGFWYKGKNKIINGGRHQLTKSLDEAPFPDRELTKCFEHYQKEYNIRGRPFAYTMTGRDCWWGKCTFCVWDSNLFPKGTFRSRTAKNAADEVEMLVNKYGVKEIFDDCGTITIGKWLTDFCNIMIERGLNKKVDYSCNMRFGYRNLKDYSLMKKAGFRLLKFGLESANQKTLQMLDKDVDVSQIIDECKDIKKAGLIVHLTMMVGYPWETKEEALNTLKLAKYLMHKGYADVLQSTVIMPYPGTPMWHQAVENKWFLPGIDPYDYEKYDMTMPLLKTVDATSEEIMEICDSIYTKVFLHPNYIYQHLKKIKSKQDIVYTLRGIKAVFGHILDFAREPSKQFSD